MSDKDARYLAVLVLWVVTMVGALFIVLLITEPAAPTVPAVTRITEDDDRWDCKRMGNRICGEVIATTTPPTVSTLPSTTTTTVVVPVTTTTTIELGSPDDEVYPPVHAKLGWFRSGWNYQYPNGIAYAQTYVGVCSGSIGHRISKMGTNPRFVYVETPGEVIERTIDGSLDQCWMDTIAALPSNAVFAPIAEANGWWTPYNGSVEQVRQAYERISMLDGGKHKMCGSFTIMGGSAAYLQAVAPYVDYACPSHYTKGGSSGATIASQARAHCATAGLPCILAQTGTEGGNVREFIDDLMSNVGSLRAVIYFDYSKWEGDWNG